MPYDYTSKEQPQNNKNKYLTAIIVVVAAVGIIGLGLRPTGQITANSLCNSIEECQKLAESSATQVQACTSERSELTSAKNRLEQSLLACENDLSDYTERYTKELANYRQLVRNTALAMCCTQSDIERSAIKSFGVENNEIFCNTGEFGINCKTGGTSY